MTTRFIPFLSLLAAALGTVYLVLMAGTVFFAGMENSLRAEARLAEARVAALEAEYYDRMDLIATADPASYGLVNPSRVVYVEEDGSPALSRAD